MGEPQVFTVGGGELTEMLPEQNVGTMNGVMAGKKGDSMSKRALPSRGGASTELRALPSEGGAPSKLKKDDEKPDPMVTGATRKRALPSRGGASTELRALPSEGGAPS